MATTPPEQSPSVDGKSGAMGASAAIVAASMGVGVAEVVEEMGTAKAATANGARRIARSVR